MSVRRLGFRAEAKQGYQVNQGERIQVDFTLTPAAADIAAVVVSGEAATGARKERLGASTKIGSGEIQEIPTANRNFTDLVSLAPLSATD